MNATLPLAWHITKKDLRPLNGLIGMSVLLALAQTLLRTLWPPLGATLDPSTTQWVESLITALPFMRMMLFVVIVALLVHADPLVSTDAFWLTRPISRRVLFLSKLLSMLLVLALPAALAQLAPMIAYGVPPLDVMWLLSENLLYFAAGLMAVFAAATLTPNQRSLAAWVIGLFILWSGVAILLSGPTMERRSEDGTMMARERRAPLRPGPGQQAAALVLLAAGCGVTVWHQYRTRSRGRSAAIAAGTAGAVLAVLYLLPRAAIAATPVSTNPPPTVALGEGIRVQNGPRSVVMWPAGERDGLCRVMVRVPQVRGIQSPATQPVPSYRFFYQPTGKNLAFTWFALPDREHELAPGMSRYGSEELELFQVLYREVIVGPTFASNDPGDATLRNVSCRDVGVMVWP